MPVLPRSRADVQIGDAVGPGSGCQEHTLRTSPSSTSWEMPPTYSSPLSPAMPHWRHLLLPSELPCCSTTVMPQTCWFEVLTLLPLSESTVSCWVSVSMGLPSNTSSSTLALASPIVLPEIVICGGCPNFIFLANCCWKTKRGKKKKKRVFILWAKQVKSNMCLFSTWKLHRNQDNNNKNQLEAHAAATRQPSHLHSPHKVTKVRNSLHQFSLWVISLSSHQCCQLLQNYCEFCNIPSGFLICVLD